MTEDSITGYPYTSIPEWILYSDVSDKAIRIFGFLSRFVGANESAFPSRATLANKGKKKYSTDTVDRALAELVDIGAILIERRKRDNGSYTSSIYRIWPDGFVQTSPQDSGHLAAALPPPSRTDAATGNNHTEGTTYKDSLSSAAEAARLEEENPDAFRLCNLLADLIEKNGSKRPGVTKTWVNDMRLMMKNDGRSATQSENMIRWCQADSFWRANIMSPRTLRKQYDKMRLRAAEESSLPKPDLMAEQRAEEARRIAREAEVQREIDHESSVPIPAHVKEGFDRLRGNLKRRNAGVESTSETHSSEALDHPNQACE